MVSEVKQEDEKGEGIQEAAPTSDIRSETKPMTIPGRTSGPTRRSTKGGWTDEEDDMLIKAVRQFNGKNWKKIAELFPDRTDVQCLHRWQKVLNPELVKGTWTKEEDNLIIQLVEKHGCKKWSVIAKSLPGRIGKQCRERWHNHLNPAIKKGAWTREEVEVLVRAHRIYGNKWAEIAKYLPGRTDNSIKNHWNCSLKKRLDSYLASGFTEQPLGAAALDLNNHAQNAECPEADPLKRFANGFISHDWKLNADRLIASNVGSGYRNTSPKNQCLELQSTSRGDSKCLRSGSIPILPEDSKHSSIELEPNTEDDSKHTTSGETDSKSSKRSQWNLSSSGELALGDMNKKNKDTSISSLPACELTGSDRTADINRILTTPLHCEDGNLGSSCYAPLQLMNVDGCFSSEKLSISNNHIQPTLSPIHCSTPDLSLSLACIPSSPESILRSAAKGFKKTPSIMRKRGRNSSKPLLLEQLELETVDRKCPSGISNFQWRAENFKDDLESEYAHQIGSNNQVNFNRSVCLNGDQLCSSHNFLKHEDSAATKSVEKRLEGEFNTEYGLSL
ncbi:transcription factor MYB3R-2-like [Phoenix dactylifera]|uniref:Transcription factor MYB3R-2-like n=1 Tax=Phoenix dactylifera TaxID=42345 RepID=A0A8B8J791_PHODC|nr:transcription factor MYB3R-2-like [Phoenix dactylifera]